MGRQHRTCPLCGKDKLLHLYAHLRDVHGMNSSERKTWLKKSLTRDSVDSILPKRKKLSRRKCNWSTDGTRETMVGNQKFTSFQGMFFHVSVWANWVGKVFLGISTTTRAEGHVWTSSSCNTVLLFTLAAPLSRNGTKYFRHHIPIRVTLTRWFRWIYDR